MNKPKSHEARRRIFVRGLMLDAFIGAYDHEQGVSQKIVIDFMLDVQVPDDPLSDALEDVVCYNRLATGVREIIAQGHIRLVETLAERIASLALAHPMALSVTVKVEKPDAIGDAAAAGVEIYRSKE